ncbi:MAG: hypothetical protein R3F56_03030 [Planctomycetota bacterium]
MQVPLATLLTAFLLLAGAAQAQTSTTWVGLVSSDWFNAANWTAGLPDDRTDAIIDTRGFAPVVAAGGAVCRDLRVLRTMTIDAQRLLGVYGSADVQANVSGDGALSFVGIGAAGTLATAPGTSVGIVRLTAGRDLTMRDVSIRLDLAYSGAGRLLWGGTVDVGRDLILTGQEVVVLSGGVAVTVGDDATLATTATMTAPFTTLSVTDDLTAGASFQPTSGEIVFTGATTHAVSSATDQWASIRLAAGSLTLPTTTVLRGSLIAEAGAALNLTALTLQWPGPNMGPFELRSATTISAQALSVPAFAGDSITLAGINFATAEVHNAALTISGQVEFDLLRLTDGSSLLGGPSDTLIAQELLVQVGSGIRSNAPGTMQIGALRQQLSTTFNSQNSTVIFTGGTVSTGIGLGAASAEVRSTLDQEVVFTSEYYSGGTPSFRFGTLSITSGAARVTAMPVGPNPPPPPVGILIADTLNVAAGASLVDTTGIDVGTLNVSGSATLTAVGTGQWGRAAAVDHLVVASGGTVAIAAHTSYPGHPLHVVSDLQVDGTMTWPAGARILLTGECTIGGDLPPLTVSGVGCEAFTATVNGDFIQTAGYLDVGQLTIAGNFSFAGEDLTGPTQSALAVSGQVDLQPTLTVTDPPDRIDCGGAWTSSANFAPTSGEVRFAGSTPQSVAAARLRTIRVNAGASVSLIGQPLVSGNITVLGAIAGTFELTGPCTLDGQGTGTAGNLTAWGPVAGPPPQFTIRDVSISRLETRFCNVYALGTTAVGSLEPTQDSLIGGDTASTVLRVGTLLFGDNTGVSSMPMVLEIGAELAMSITSSFNTQEGVIVFKRPPLDGGTAGGTVHVSEPFDGGRLSAIARIEDGTHVQFGGPGLRGGGWSLDVVDGTAEVVGHPPNSMFAPVLHVAAGSTFLANDGVTLGDVTLDGTATLVQGSRLDSLRGSGAITMLPYPNDHRLLVHGDLLFDGTLSGPPDTLVEVDADARLRGALPEFEHTAGTATIEQLTVARAATFRGAALADGLDGASLVAAGGDVRLQTTGAVTTPPDRIECGGDWTSNANFAPASGTIAFTGTGIQTVSFGPPPLHDVEIGAASAVTLGDLHITGSLLVAGSLTLTGATLQVGQSATVPGTLTAANAAATIPGALVVPSGGTATLGGVTHALGSLDVAGDVTFPANAALDFAGGGMVRAPSTSPLPRTRLLSGGYDVPAATLASDLVQEPACLSLALGDVDVAGDATFLGGTVTGSTLAAVQDLVVGGDVRFETHNSTTSPPARIEVQGNWTTNQLFLPASGHVLLAGTTTLVDHTQASGVCEFFDLTFAAGTTTPQDRMEAKGPACRIAAGATLDMGTRRLILAPGSTTTIEGTLRLDQAGSLLGLFGSEMRFVPGSTLFARGRPTNHAKLIGVVSGFELGGHIDANNLTIDGLDERGVRILESATFAAAPFDMRGVTISTGSTAPGARMVDVARGAAQTLELWDWELMDNGPSQYGVASSGAGRIDLINFSGGRGSATFELDPGNVLFWSERRTELAAHSATGGFLGNRVGFTTTREVAMNLLRVSRAPAASGPWSVLTTLMPQGSSSSGATYAHDDGAVLAGEEWFYRVEEKLLHDAWRPLFDDRARAFASQVGDTAFVGPGGFASIDAALAAVPLGGSVVVAPGTHAPFTITRPVHLVAAGGGTTRIVGGTPAVISGLLPTDGEVAIQGLTFGDGVTAGGAELLRIDGARNVVLLDDVGLLAAPGQDALRLVGAPQVKLQQVVANARVAADASIAYAARCTFAALDLRNAARVTHAATTTGPVTRDGSSTLVSRPGGSPRLDSPSLWQGDETVPITVRGESGHLFGVTLDLRLAFLDLSFFLPLDMVLMQAAPVAFLSGVVPPGGEVEIPLLAPQEPALHGQQLALQVFALDLVTATGRFGSARHAVMLP